MARYFDITALTTLISLDAERKGVASLTVTNATNASIRGDAVVIPKSGAKPEWFTIDHASRHYDPGASEQLSVAIDAGMDAAPATYGFQVRVLLGGGVPEEQFDDGPLVQFDVAEIPAPPPEPPAPPPKRGIPWWVFLVAGLIAVVVIGGVVAFVLTRPKPSTLTVVTVVINDNGFTATPADFSQHVIGESAVPSDFAGTGPPGASVTLNAGSYEVRQDPRAGYARSFSGDCSGVMGSGDAKTCFVTNNDWFIIFEPIPLPLPVQNL